MRLQEAEGRRLVVGVFAGLCVACAAGALGQERGVAAPEGERGGGEATVEQLVQQIKRGDRQAQLLALGELSRRGEQAAAAVPELIELLSDEQVRYFAVRALGGLGEAAAPAVGALTDALKDDEASFAASAATALGKIGVPAAPALPELVRVAEDESSAVVLRVMAAGALGEIGARADEAMDALVGLLDGGHWRVQTAAIDALGGIGERALPVLVGLVGGEDDKKATAAARALGRVGQSAVGALMEALGDSRAPVRASAATGLGMISSPGPVAVAKLADLLTDDASADERLGTVGEAAAAALGMIGPDARGALRELLAAAGRGNVRAIQALGKVGKGSGDVTSALLAVLERHPEAEAEALEALGDLGRGAASAAPKLFERLTKAEDETARDRMGVALARIGRPAIKQVLAGLRSGDAGVRTHSARILGMMGESAAETIPQLMDVALHDDEHVVRSSAATALGQMGDQGIAALIGKLGVQRDRRRAVVALVRIGPAAVPALSEKVNGDDVLASLSAIQALLQYGGRAESALPALKRATQHRDPSVRAYAAQAVEKIENAS